MPHPIAVPESFSHSTYYLSNPVPYQKLIQTLVWSERAPSEIEVSDVPGHPDLEMVKCAVFHQGEFDRKAFVKIEVREVE